MCLSKAYVEGNGGRELLLEEITSVTFEKDKLLFKTLFGEEKEIEAGIRQIDFITNSISLENVTKEDKPPRKPLHNVNRVEKNEE